MCKAKTNLVKTQVRKQNSTTGSFLDEDSKQAALLPEHRTQLLHVVAKQAELDLTLTNTEISFLLLRPHQSVADTVTQYQAGMQPAFLKQYT